MHERCAGQLSNLRIVSRSDDRYRRWPPQRSLRMTRQALRGPFRHGSFNHASLTLAERPVSSSLASGVITIPGLIVLIRARRFLQCTASAMTRSEFPRFES